MAWICFDQLVERGIVGFGIELRRLDDEQRRDGVVEEEVLVGLVQLAQVVLVGRGSSLSGSLLALASRSTSSSVGACR